MGRRAPESRPLALIGLGSNLGDPVSEVSSALVELDAGRHSRVLARSGVYRSLPLGPPGQPDYINAVAMLETSRDPLGLLSDLMALEQVHGRVRNGGVRWGPRILDLDLLLFGDVVLNDRRLCLPHPEMANRSFVLFPLLEIVGPSFVIPGLGKLETLCSRVSPAGLWRLRSHVAYGECRNWEPVDTPE